MQLQKQTGIPITIPIEIVAKSMSYPNSMSSKKFRQVTPNQVSHSKYNNKG